jgi:hypothetical protein
VTGVLDSLHHELPIHETPKRSRLLDLYHQGPSNLVQELMYRISGFEESKDLTRLHFELPVTEVPIWPGPSDQGGDLQPSISTKGQYRISGFEESKDWTLGLR